MAEASVEFVIQASTAAFMLSVVMLVSKTWLVLYAEAGRKAKSATEMIKLLRMGIFVQSQAREIDNVALSSKKEALIMNKNLCNAR